MSKNVYVSILCGMSLSGCGSAPIAPPINSGSGTELNVSVKGLKKHVAYPNDVLWLHVFEGEISKDEQSVGRQKFTVEQPSASIRVDAKSAYTISLTSFEGHFGGYTSCTTIVPLPKIVASATTYSLDYATTKSTCEATLSTTASGKTVSNKYQGSLGGVQYSAHVTTVPAK